MSTATRAESVTAGDAAGLPCHLAIPASGRGPGVLVLQEIFGVNDYVRGRCETLAGLGYVAMAPDLYWRLEPGVEIAHDEAGLQRAFGYLQRLDEPLAVRDAGAALDRLRGLPEVTGTAGVLGFCMGGRIGYHVTARFRPDAAVLYYGSGTADALELAGEIRCPVLFHFGGDDQYLPAEQVERIRAAFRGRDDLEFDVQPGAGHAFDNYLAPMFHVAHARRAAWALTEDFLRRRLPAG
ncbi:MAG TPA: dienelactone hydrolase family protein [Candidatus Eisenbacteria bacterium]|nr:dienelactone hydrolase family protein [Candidatus Eisenbacteria bacterium]